MRNYCSKQKRRMKIPLLKTKYQTLLQKAEQLETQTQQKTAQLSQDPVEFCKKILGFTPYTYQTEFIRLFQSSDFLAARWCRQSGKSYIISALLLWYAVTNPNSAIGIIGPSWRQTKRILNRIISFSHKLPPNTTLRPQKTQLNFTNKSTIEAFPNNPETIRGPTLNVVYCLAPHTLINLPDDTKTPISKLKPGQQVLSYNINTKQIQPKKILNIYQNPLANRKIIQIIHPYGVLECTNEHKIYTQNRAYLPAQELTYTDTLLTPKSSTQLRNKALLQNPPYQTVYNLEVEDNHNYFATNILISNCDEMNFIANDQELYNAILYTLGTTDGKFVCRQHPLAHRQHILQNLQPQRLPQL